MFLPLSLTPLKLISITVFCMLIVGYANRRRPKVHIPLMVAAFVIDMAVVLYIELTRHAIEQAATHLGPLMGVHIALSVTVIALYVGQIITGLKKRRGMLSHWHGNAGLWLIVARLGNLITSFMVT